MQRIMLHASGIESTRNFMISVVIPTLNAEAGLAETLAALIPAVVSGLVKEVIIVDGGSTDRTLQIVDDGGAILVTGSRDGRGPQLRLGAQKARQPWLLFLHADTVLDGNWMREAHTFIERVETGRYPLSAAAFKFALDDFGFRPRMLEALVRLRCLLFRLPYGDQGLLVPSRLYREVGGYPELPLMEDVSIVRRLGWRRIRILNAEAVTSAIRYRNDGYVRRSMRNVLCLGAYFLGVPAHRIQRLYGTFKSP